MILAWTLIIVGGLGMAAIISAIREDLRQMREEQRRHKMQLDAIRKSILK